MAWLWGDTFDHYHEWWQKYENALVGDAANGAGWMYIDAAYGRLPATGGARFYNCYAHKVVTPGPSHVGGRVCIVSMWMRVYSLNQESFLCSIRTTDNTHTQVQFTVELSGAISVWAKFQGVQTSPMVVGVGGTRVGRTASGTIIPGQWHLVEFQVLCETGGTIAVRVDRRIVLTLTEQPTANQDATPGWGSVAFGSTVYTDVDMLVICDGVGPTFNAMPGLTTSEYLHPVSSAGNWTPNVVGYPHTTMLADPMADGDNTVVFASPANPLPFDQYQLSNLSLIKAGVAMVQGITSARTITNPRTIGHLMYGGGGWSQTYRHFAVQDVSGLYRVQRSVWPTSPAAGAPWTVADFAYAWIGIAVTS